MTRGKPSAVIIPLDEYRDMLARLEDADDMKVLKNLRKKPLRFRSLDAFLKETAGGV
jgi:PHD/YefM family antitoxin component YafN of YafNO toxin-antitoxin module